MSRFWYFWFNRLSFRLSRQCFASCFVVKNSVIGAVQRFDETTKSLIWLPIAWRYQLQSVCDRNNISPRTTGLLRSHICSRICLKTPPHEPTFSQEYGTSINSRGFIWGEFFWGFNFSVPGGGGGERLRTQKPYVRWTGYTNDPCGLSTPNTGVTLDDAQAKSRRVWKGFYFLDGRFLSSQQPGGGVLRQHYLSRITKIQPRLTPPANLSTVCLKSGDVPDHFPHYLVVHETVFAHFLWMGVQNTLIILIRNTEWVKHNVQKFGRPGDLQMSQNGPCVLKLNLSGASIALNFNGPKRMESYKNEKSNILTPDYKQINLTPVHMFILNIFKKSQIYTPHFSFEKHLNKYWNLQK